MKKLMGLGLGLWLAAGMASAQQKLSLEDYLTQVKAQGPEYQSAKASAEGLEKQAHQQDLIYSPVLVAGYNHMDDKEPSDNLEAQPHTQADSAGVSIGTKFPFGPSLSVGYSLINANVELNPLYNSVASLLNFPNPFYQVAPVVSLSVPLFKDFGGAQTGAGVHKIQYQLQSAQKGTAFLREKAAFDAKLAYWSLALSHNEVAIRQDTLNRCQKIWDWTKKRVARNLADPPDALQAEASVRVAELDLQMAQEKERSARFSFNRLRGVKDDQVTEELENLENSLTSIHVDIPNNLPDRLDLKAAELTAKSQQAAYDEAYQNIYPDITAYASWKGNGYTGVFNPANQDAFSGTYSTYNIGAQFTLPLDLITASRVAEGYKANYESSLLTLKDKKIDVGQQWKDLKDRLQDVEHRLSMATEIESLQKRNAEEEKKELELGRATQFQLLSFENGYSLSRLNRLSLVVEKLSYLAQAQWWLSTEKQ